MSIFLLKRKKEQKTNECVAAQVIQDAICYYTNRSSGKRSCGVSPSSSLFI